MEDCIFCKIVKKEVPSTFIWEDDDVFVFNDRNPKAPVHFLVIPKVHIQSIAHLEDRHQEVAGKLLLAVKRVAAEKGLSAYKVAANVGREAGQVVDHLHLHVLGGWKDPKTEAKELIDRFMVPNNGS